MQHVASRHRLRPSSAWRGHLRVAVLSGLFLLLAAGKAAAVSVTPNALYIDHRSRSGTLTLFNEGTRPEEIEISFAYGYPQSDEQGNITVPILEQVPAGAPSAVEWLRAFPRRLVLQPGQRQVVRILVQPPADLPDREYWARVIITSRGGQRPVEQTFEDISVRMNLETVVITAVNYRKGPVQTGVQVRGASVKTVPGGARLLLDLQREGNAAFLGRVVARVLDEKGAVLSETTDYVAVYEDLRVGMDLALPPGGIPQGARIEYRIDTTRPDLTPGAALRAEGRTGSVPLS
jgi:hypothetical protein